MRVEVPKKQKQTKREEEDAKGPLVFTPHAGAQAKYFSTDAKIIIAGGGAGGGKAQPLTATVWTPLGPKPMGDVHVGDFVSNPDGGSSRVIGVFPQPAQQIYKLTFSDGAATRATADHLWVAAIARRRGRGLRTMTTLEMRGRLARGQRPLVPLTAPVELRSAPEDKPTVDPYLLGLLLGDGCLLNNQISITTADEQIEREVIARTPTAVRVSRDERSRARQINFVGIRSLRSALIELGVYDKRAEEKRVPHNYMDSPVSVRMEVLRGLMDTDGTVDSRGHTHFYSASRGLAEDVQWIARSLGAKASLTKKRGRYKKDGVFVECLDCFIVNIRHRKPSDLFCLDRKRSRCTDSYNGGDAEPARRLISVEEDGFEEARCIAVDHPNHLYVTDDFIVTHNTMALLMEPLVGLEYAGFSAAMFRKTLEMHKVSGGLRSESLVWYDRVPGNNFNATELNWHFDQGCSIKFYGCDKVTKFDGMQAAYLGIDQVEQLTADEFWHLCSRVRSTARHPVTGELIQTKIRATCNPEPGWLEKLLKGGGYVGRNGLPVKEMDGIVRWFVRDQKTDEIVWADELEDFGELDADGQIISGERAGLIPSSFTFIRFPLSENISLPPSYKAELQNMTIAERRKKLEGNWNLWTGGGGVYRARWWGLKGDAWGDSPNRVEYLSPDQSRDVRLAWAWDIGWTANSDWTVGVLFGQGSSCWYVLDMIKFRAREHVTFEAVARCAKILDDTEIPVVLPRDPGKAGVDQANWQQQLGALGMIAHLCPDDGKVGDKVLRHRYLAPQAEQGRLKIVTEWRPSAPVSFWVSQQTDEGKAVECTTVDGWAMELVQCLDALSHDCPHVVTDVCDGVARGHRWMTQMDPAGAARMALVMTPPKDWQSGDKRIDVARAATSQWSRDRPSHQKAARGDGTDWMFARRRR